MQRWNGCLGLTTTDCLRRLGIFHLPKLKIITIGNLPVKPPQRGDLNQLASLIPGAIQVGWQLLVHFALIADSIKEPPVNEL